MGVAKSGLSARMGVAKSVLVPGWVSLSLVLVPGWVSDLVPVTKRTASVFSSCFPQTSQLCFHLSFTILPSAVFHSLVSFPSFFLSLFSLCSVFHLTIANPLYFDLTHQCVFNRPCEAGLFYKHRPHSFINSLDLWNLWENIFKTPSLPICKS